MKTISYYFCDACHFCFKASIFPGRCPDCGKRMIGILPAVRMATNREIADYIRIREELDAEDGN
ncbi:MAG: hypothetical protein MR436_13335 [Eubacterium sp.]|nr:hypothetical protein [Eubacterium sp.]